MEHIYVKESFAQYIFEHIQGRKLVFRGEDDELESYLLEHYGLEVESYVVYSKANINDRSFHISEMKSKFENYYLVIPTITEKDNDVKYLQNMGMEQGIDYIYYNHRRTKVTSTDIDKNMIWKDIYGNTFSGELPDKCTVSFTGWGGIAYLRRAWT